MLVIFQEEGLCDLHACRGIQVGYIPPTQEKEIGRILQNTMKTPIDGLKQVFNV